MILGFIVYGLGWNFVWSAHGKATKHTMVDMPLWFSGSSGQNTLAVLTLLGGLSHLVISIIFFSWLKGILFWIIVIISNQIIIALIFNDARTKNPAPPFFIGLLSMVIGLLLLAVS